MEDGGWRMEDGRWTMDDGRWTMDDGRWTMDDGHLILWILSAVRGMFVMSTLKASTSLDLARAVRVVVRMVVRVLLAEVAVASCYLLDSSSCEAMRASTTCW